jgi:hypothetical protein
MGLGSLSTLIQPCFGVCKSYSPSQALTALLAFAQRQIRASRAHIPPNRDHRKHISTVIKTLGDYIQAKRYEKGLQEPADVGRQIPARPFWRVSPVTNFPVHAASEPSQSAVQGALLRRRRAGQS